MQQYKGKTTKTVNVPFRGSLHAHDHGHDPMGGAIPAQLW